MIERRKGMEFPAASKEGTPLKLEMDDDKVRVTREGKLVAFLTKLGIIRSQEPPPGDDRL